MARKVIHTNPHLKTREDRVDRVARSQAVSAKIEGIKVSYQTTKKMAEKAARKSVRRK